jgi:flagellar biosynthesis protein FlhF
VVQNELAELKSMVLKLANQNEIEKAAEIKKPGKSKIKMKMIENDIPEEILEELSGKIKEKNKDIKINSKSYEMELLNSLKEIIKTDNKYDERIQVLVGPTGVGKTTTIAKLASLYTLYKNKKEGLITLDTYRIGAVEQLKTYAEILGVPFGVILSIKDIPQVIKTMENCEIILVDTMGRNSKNIMQISEIRKFVEEMDANKIHLVISMTTKQKDLKKIINNYKMIKYNSLILTKIDETEVNGSILASLYYSNVPVSYISTGQNVPEDIEEANKDKIIKLVMGAEA